jgi:hypothetical protein
MLFTVLGQIKPIKRVTWLWDKYIEFIRTAILGPTPRRRAFRVVGLATAYVSLLSMLTNPYGRISVFRDIYNADLDAELLKMTRVFDLRTRDSIVVKRVALVKNAWHILYYSIFSEQGVKGVSTVEQIISKLHEIRFDPSKPYIISGGHFSVFYPRSLGIFYYPTLNSRIHLSDQDWENRQKVYAESTAFAIESFKKCGDLYTTITPMGDKAVSCINIYHYPSDSLYSVLFAIDKLMGGHFVSEKYLESVPPSKLSTKKIGQDLLSARRQDLAELLDMYNTKVFDPDSYLVRKDISLSSTKDIGIQESSFYDNVIFWSTNKLAAELGVILEPEIDLERLRANILDNFWNEELGIFKEDLASGAENFYSSDWLIAVTTGFLDISNEQDRKFVESAISYVNNNDIDEPFPLRYHNEMRKDRLVGVVRLATPEYGTNAIWSFWGTEYIKTLLFLYAETQNDFYLAEAQRHLRTYTKNIEKYKGFPEVYDSSGELMDGFFYRSVVKTGWVINYEEAKLLERVLTN